MWNDIKLAFKAVYDNIMATVALGIVLGWVLWYTGHLGIICNQAGCIINFK